MFGLGKWHSAFSLLSFALTKAQPFMKITPRFISIQPSQVRLLIALILGLFTLPTLAQVPSPGPPQTRPILLLGGTAHLGTGEVIESSAIAFEQGKITAVMNASEASTLDTARYEVIDTQGQHIYPGFIIPNTDLGLKEIGAVRATIDNAEAGTLNPNIRSLISYNTDSEIIPTFRFNGILLAQITPQSGLIPGTSSVVQLDAWNWEDAAVKKDDALHLHWPGRFKGQFDFVTYTFNRVPNEQFEEQLRMLENLFADAKVYSELNQPAEINQKLEALRGLFSGERALFVHANEAKEIIESVLFAEKHGVQRIVLVGGAEAMDVQDFIKEKNIPVILENVHRLPETHDTDVAMPYKLPRLLHDAGILVSISYTESMNARGRNLPFLAGTAAAYGLDKEVALQMITANTAKILGIAEQVGTLEKGKQATLFVSQGDALDMRTNQLSHAFIDGRKVTLPAMQQQLYQKYKEKFEAGATQPAGTGEKAEE